MYAIHTYAGYENAVARNLKQPYRVSRMEDKIFSVSCLRRRRQGQVRQARRGGGEDIPGYVLVEMIVTEIPVCLRNTPARHRFVGSGVNPCH